MNSYRSGRRNPITLTYTGNSGKNFARRRECRGMKKSEERRKYSRGGRVKGGIGPFKCEDYHARSIDEHVTFRINRRCIVPRERRRKIKKERKKTKRITMNHDTKRRYVASDEKKEKKNVSFVTRKAETRRID